MAEIKLSVHLELEEFESHALAKLLGNMNDHDYEKFGVSGADRQAMHDIWSQLPDRDDRAG